MASDGISGYVHQAAPHYPHVSVLHLCIVHILLLLFLYHLFPNCFFILVVPRTAGE